MVDGDSSERCLSGVVGSFRNLSKQLKRGVGKDINCL